CVEILFAKQRAHGPADRLQIAGVTAPGPVRRQQPPLLRGSNVWRVKTLPLGHGHARHVQVIARVMPQQQSSICTGYVAVYSHLPKACALLKEMLVRIDEGRSSDLLVQRSDGHDFLLPAVM